MTDPVMADTTGAGALRDRLNAMQWPQPDYRFTCNYMVDLMLAEIEAAGYKIVPPGGGNFMRIGGVCWSHDGHEWAGWFDESLVPDNPTPGGDGGAG